jgi:hypothetical protein
MDRRLLACTAGVFVILLAAFAGCASSSTGGVTTTPSGGDAAGTTTTTGGVKNVGTRVPTAVMTQSAAEQLSLVKSDNPVWKEAYRMFLNIKETEYTHPPYTVDDAAGIYLFDCLGFVDHVLMNADPDGYKVIGKGTNPSIESYAAYFDKLSTTTADAQGWTKVDRPVDLKPGDVCLWLKPTTLDTGHMWIVAGTPSVNPERKDEVLVRIFDSSFPHSVDSRTDSIYKTGLGSGILGMMVDANGNPAGLYWDGGVSSAAGEKDTTIVCGRLTT